MIKLRRIFSYRLHVPLILFANTFLDIADIQDEFGQSACVLVSHVISGFWLGYMDLTYLTALATGHCATRFPVFKFSWQVYLTGYFVVKSGEIKMGAKSE